MDLIAFKSSIVEAKPPSEISSALQALWWDAKGDWNKAHHCVQAQEDALGAWVHAYLHRLEGDLDNARYWYGQAEKPVARGELASEWDAIAKLLLAA